MCEGARRSRLQCSHTQPAPPSLAAQKRVKALEEHHASLCARYNRDVPRLTSCAGTLAHAQHKRDAMKRKIANFQRTHTPRPRWGGLATRLDGVVPFFSLYASDSDDETGGLSGARKQRGRKGMAQASNATKKVCVARGACGVIELAC